MMAIAYIRTMTVIAYLAFAGCSPSAIPTEPPASWMMKAPKPLEDVPAGANFKTLYADLRLSSGKEKQQLKGLQSYVRTLQGK